MSNVNGHDGEGLAHDLATLLDRRRAIRALGLAVAGAALGGCDVIGAFGHAEANVTGTAADGSTCIKLPGETAGPFPGDGTNSRAGSTVNVLDRLGVVRSDIRPSFDGLTVTAQGAELVVTIKLVDVKNACAPLSGRAIYLWHCDAQGHYSLYDLPDSNALRGVGITDVRGEVSFTTIFPGCYSGRWPHFHFEIFADKDKAANGDQSLLTSQFALPQEACKTVYAGSAAYAASAEAFARVSLDGDGIFGDNTPEQLTAQLLAVSGNGPFAALGVIGMMEA